MRHKSTLYRRKQREEAPDKYEEYKKQQREKAAKRRQEDKKKWEDGQLTPAQVKERVVKIKEKRAQMRARYHKKRLESGLPTRNSCAETDSIPRKRPRDMSPNELRKHKAEKRREQRANLSHQKKTALKRKRRAQYKKKKPQDGHQTGDSSAEPDPTVRKGSKDNVGACNVKQRNKQTICPNSQKNTTFRPYPVATLSTLCLHKLKDEAPDKYEEYKRQQREKETQTRQEEGERKWEEEQRTRAQIKEGGTKVNKKRAQGRVNKKALENGRQIRTSSSKSDPTKRKKLQDMSLDELRKYNAERRVRQRASLSHPEPTALRQNTVAELSTLCLCKLKEESLDKYTDYLRRQREREAEAIQEDNRKREAQHTRTQVKARKAETKSEDTVASLSTLCLAKLKEEASDKYQEYLRQQKEEGATRKLEEDQHTRAAVKRKRILEMSVKALERATFQKKRLDNRQQPESSSGELGHPKRKRLQDMSAEEFRQYKVEMRKKQRDLENLSGQKETGLNQQIVPSRSTLYWRKLKEEAPEKYQKYLSNQRERAAKRRQDKRKCEEEEQQHTRAQVEERETIIENKRSPERTRYHPKKLEKSHLAQNSAAMPGPVEGKRPIGTALKQNGMPNHSTLYRRKLKEEAPDRYEEYLSKSRERSTKRRQEDKRKWEEGLLTSAQVKEREIKAEYKRAVERARYLKQKLEWIRLNPNSSAKLYVATTGRKRPRDMSQDELRQYRTEMRRKQRANLSHQKKTAIKKKRQERRRIKKEEEKQLLTARKGEKRSSKQLSMSQAKHTPLTQTLRNFRTSVNKTAVQKQEKS